MIHVSAFLGGLGTWTFLEYATHRWLLHGPLLRWHLPHHQQPRTGRFDWKPSLIAGLLAGFVVYSSVHHRLHQDRNVAGLLSHHEAHHDRPDRNFGVTTRFWDRIFSTQNP